MDIFSLKTKMKELLKIRIFKVLWDMQLNMGGKMTLMPGNFIKNLRKPRLKPSHFQLNQFDGSLIKS